MTRVELDAIWTRYIHRSDIAADLDTVFDLTTDRIQERLKFDTIDTADILANYPRTYVHGGLSYLHELAQDDIGEAREERRFADAIADLSFRKSIDAGRKVATRPYFDVEVKA